MGRRSICSLTFLSRSAGSSSNSRVVPVISDHRHHTHQVCTNAKDADAYLVHAARQGTPCEKQRIHNDPNFGSSLRRERVRGDLIPDHGGEVAPARGHWVEYCPRSQDCIGGLSRLLMTYDQNDV